MIFTLKHASDFYGKDDKEIEVNSMLELEQIQVQNNHNWLIINFADIPPSITIYDDYIE